MLGRRRGMAAPAAEKKSLLQEFKEFINKGNIVEVAVAFVLGIAFKTVIDAVAGNGNDNPGIIGGIIGAIFGGDQPNFAARGITVNDSFIPIGAFVSSVINFLLVALVLFVIVKMYNRMRRQAEAAGAGPAEVELL